MGNENRVAVAVRVPRIAYSKKQYLLSDFGGERRGGGKRTKRRNIASKICFADSLICFFLYRATRATVKRDRKYVAHMLGIYIYVMYICNSTNFLFERFIYERI